MFFSIFRPHLNAACAKFRVKRVSACIYGTTYNENSTVVLASVGLVSEPDPRTRKEGLVNLGNDKTRNGKLGNRK